MTHQTHQNPVARAVPSLARFQPRAATNCRLALELIADPALHASREADPPPEFSALLQEAAVLVVALAQAAETFSVQRRLMEEVGFPLLESSQARLQTAAATIARRLLIALASAGRSRSPGLGLLDAVLDHADALVVHAVDAPSLVSDGLPATIASAIARALSVGSSARSHATEPVVEAAGAAIALFVLVGTPTPSER